MAPHEIKKHPLISVCIPSYNRPDYLRDLLETIAEQSFHDYEVVVCDDDSPLTKEIENVVADIQENNQGQVFRYIRNNKTLGYDGNFRGLLSHAKGKYCVYMGDDDLLCSEALSRIASVINKNPDIGVIIRSWARAERESKVVVEDFRYFAGDRLFEPGRRTVATLFRRSVQIAGYTINRKYALEHATSKLDGTLLYQLYLSGVVTYTHRAYYISDRIAIMRKDANQKPTHFFGNAEVERKRFKPGKLSTDISLNFVTGMVEVAKFVSDFHKDKDLYDDLLRDMGNYSYPLLSVQRDKTIKEFVKYFMALRSLDLGRNPFFYFYFLFLLFLGRRLSGKIIIWVKNIVGKTPALGNLYEGIAISSSD